MKKTMMVAAVALLLKHSLAFGDEVIFDDLVVTESVCVGSDCVDGEDFIRDNLRLKSDDPLIRFQDTSNAASFPQNDWSMGITDSATSNPAQFFIHDESAGVTVLRLDGGGNGGVALGAGAVIEDGAVSIGAAGTERRIVHVADGIDPTDAATMGQFTAFTDAFNAELATERAEVDAELADLQARIDALNDRIDVIIDELNE